MEESYGEDLASHSGLQPSTDSGNAVGVSIGGEGSAGQPWSSEIITSVGRSCSDKEKATTPAPPRARRGRLRRSVRTWACVEIPNARTGRSQRFPSPTTRNGQKTPP